ncbi:MAG: aminoglycoside phosphotransferase family protein [Litorilinea sp.]
MSAVDASPNPESESPASADVGAGVDADADIRAGAELTTSIIAYLQSAPTSEFQGQAITVERAWQGHDNLLWLVRAGTQQAIVKLFLEAGQARGRRQFDGQSAFAPQGLAPAPLWFDRYPHGLARQILVYAWEEGTPPDLGDAATLMALAQTIATVHGAGVDTVRRVCPHPVNLETYWRIETGALHNAQRHTQRAGALDMADAVQQLATHADDAVGAAHTLWQGAPPTPVHGDLLPENCLIHTRGYPLLLDWEMYGLGDPALDMARLLFHLPPQPQAIDTGALLDTYLGLVDQSELADRIAVYSRLLPLQALAYLLNGVHSSLQQASTPSTRREISQNLAYIAQAVEAALASAASAFALHAIVEKAPATVAAWQAHVIEQLSPD